jgi:hypothetical protein
LYARHHLRWVFLFLVLRPVWLQSIIWILMDLMNRNCHGSSRRRSAEQRLRVRQSRLHVSDDCFILKMWTVAFAFVINYYWRHLYFALWFGWRRRQTWAGCSNKTSTALASARIAVSVSPDGENPTEMPWYSTRFHR